MSVSNDSIVALSTPPGRSGIGIVRISGAGSLDILRTLIADPSFAPEPGFMNLRTLVDPSTGDNLDEALVCYFRAPHSFTGEDVVELHCHGSPVLLRTLVDLLLGLNARLADPGEFSLRAVVNGRLPLNQAEAIRDLINAQTETALKQATRQLKGEVSNRLQSVKEELLKVIVRLESSLEFVEDDLPAVAADEIVSALEALRSKLVTLAGTFSRGRLLSDGLKVALLGRPNVGKSSLFNALLGHGRAIVTDIPGTTRDTISEPIDLNGIPVLLIDTAGIRASRDEIETMGIDRTRREAADADLLLIVLDGSQEVVDEDHLVLDELDERPHVIAINKSDLPTFKLDRLAGLSIDDLTAEGVSAKTGEGLDRLRTAILEPFVAGSTPKEGLLITNARHHDLLMRSAAALEASEQLIRARASEELILVGLHEALNLLGEITGETTTDDILGQIFSTFCIGK